MDDMEAAYKMGDDRSLCIKYKTSNAMEEALRIMDTVKFKYANGKSVDVRISPAGINIRYVRIFDVPPEVSDDDVSSIFGKYGKVERVIREKFSSDLGLGHIFNGVRGLYIDIEKTIPSMVDVLHWKAKVFYEELKNKCFLCHSEGHQKNTCPQRNRQAKRKVEEKTTTTYAGVVKQADVISDALETVEVLEDDIIEEIQLETIHTEEVQNGIQESRKEMEPVVYKSEYERNLAENWAKHEAEKRKRQEEYRRNEKSMQRRYQEGLKAMERERMEHWEKCEAERKSRQEKHKRDASLQRQAHLVKEQVRSPPKKNSRIQ